MYLSDSLEERTSKKKMNRFDQKKMKYEIKKAKGKQKLFQTKPKTIP